MSSERINRMQNAITPFDFEGNAIRTMTDDRGDAWFVAADVCRVLGLPNVSQAASRLDPDERGNVTTNDAIGRSSDVVIISEAGVYRLIFTSRKESAERFKRWLAHDVLPAIRKTGGYAVQSMTPAQQLLMAAQQLVNHERQINEHETRLARIEAQVGSQAPDYYTIKGWAKLNRLRAPNEAEAQRLGKSAAALSRDRDVPIEQTPHADYGTVNRYAQSVLEVVFKGWR